MKKILCITLNPAIDMTIRLEHLALGEVNRATDSVLTPAGKGLNVAHVLSELGVSAVATGFLGSDNDGIFNELFASHAHFLSMGKGEFSGMSDGFVRVAGETRTNIKLVDNGRTTDVNGQGFTVLDDDKKALFDKLATLIVGVDAVLVAGSLPKGFGVDDFDALLDFLTKNHPKVAVDVSGEALKVALKHNLWLIKPNNDELSEAFGRTIRTLDEQQQAITNIQGDIANVVVSMGSQGVHWFCQTDHQTQAIYHGTPPRMTVVSTVGAGDTMVASMMFGLLTKSDPLEILANATALSAYAVSVVGVKVPNDEVFKKLLADTHVSAIYTV